VRINVEGRLAIIVPAGGHFYSSPDRDHTSLPRGTCCLLDALTISFTAVNQLARCDRDAAIRESEAVKITERSLRLPRGHGADMKQGARAGRELGEGSWRRSWLS